MLTAFYNHGFKLQGFRVFAVALKAMAGRQGSKVNVARYALRVKNLPHTEPAKLTERTILLIKKKL
jgi:hypothetical protein